MNLFYLSRKYIHDELQHFQSSTPDKKVNVLERERDKLGQDIF